MINGLALFNPQPMIWAEKKEEDQGSVTRLVILH